MASRERLKTIERAKNAADDITHLLQSAKVPHALFGGRVPASAQVTIVEA
jgi:hypothetical protein